MNIFENMSCSLLGSVVILHLFHRHLQNNLSPMSVEQEQIYRPPEPAYIGRYGSEERTTVSRSFESNHHLQHERTKLSTHVIFLVAFLGSSFQFYIATILWILTPILMSNFSYSYRLTAIVYFTPLLMVWFGSVVYGNAGDSVGRKTAFSNSLLYSGLFCFLIACVPNAAIHLHFILISLFILGIVNLAGIYTGGLLTVSENSNSLKNGFLYC